jgi:3-oxoacyl-[acyl-carrier protein] reductase
MAAAMLEGKVVLITGASRGIGRYVAHTFAAERAKLAVADIRPLERVADELRDLGVDTLAINADVRDEAAIAALMERVVGHFGRIDVLVNNAGIPTHTMGVRPYTRDMDKAFWDSVIDTNLGGTFLCTKHALPYMERQRSGHVVNVFGGGTPGSPGSAVYVASKTAVRTFTRFVAEEEREWNVCVVAVTPGGQISTEEDPEEVRRRIPGVEAVGNRFVLAAQVGMESTGKLFTLRDGKLEVVD